MLLFRQIRDERENEDLQRQRDIYHKSLGPAAGVVVKNESKGAQGGGLLSSSSSLGGGNGQEQGLQTPSRPLLGVGRKR